MCESPRAAITKYRELEVLTTEMYSLRVLETKDLKIQRRQGQSSRGRPLVWLSLSAKSYNQPFCDMETLWVWVSMCLLSSNFSNCSKLTQGREVRGIGSPGYANSPESETDEER